LLSRCVVYNRVKESTWNKPQKGHTGQPKQITKITQQAQNRETATYSLVVIMLPSFFFCVLLLLF